MGESYRLWTPEQIEVQFDIAGLGSRLLAGIVDQFVLAAAFIAVFMGAGVLGAVSNRAGGRTADYVVGFMVLLLFVIWFGYYIFFEWVWSGQTPGKRALGLRVIRDSGSPIGLAEAAIRNIIRMVDYLPFGYAVGILTMLLNRRSKRLGDFAAGTIVVKERRHVRLDPLQGDFPHFAGAESDLPDVTSLTSADYVLVRRYFQRQPDLTPEDRSRLAREVLVAIGPRLVWPEAAIRHAATPEYALALVAQAYQAAARARS